MQRWLNIDKKRIILIICLLFFSSSGYAFADWHSESFGGSVTVSDVSVIRVLPVVSEISEYDDFIVSIYCEPSEYVKTYIFDLHFNQSVIHAKNVVEGDFFEGFSTFFSDGSINNTDGVITSIYSLTLGPGQENMTDQPGYLCNITFEPVVATGSSSISFSYSGTETGYLTNNVTYLSCTIENGSVDLDISDFPVISWHSSSFGGSVTVEDGVDNPPVFSNEQPSDGAVNQSFNPVLQVDCSNDDGSNFDLYIRSNVSGVWVTLDSWTNVGNNTGSSMFHVTPSSMNSYDTTFYWSVNASDNHGGSNSWTNETYSFTTLASSSEDVVWHSSSFGGSVTVDDGLSETIWHSSSFGGSVTVRGDPVMGNWSEVFVLGQTSETDTNLDMIVNYQDTGDVGLYYGDSGDPGWINADVNNDGDVNYLDTGAVALDYGNDYT